MKNTILILLVLIVSTSYAQDTIIKVNNDTLSVVVKEINDNEVVFTYVNESLINKLSTTSIKLIKFNSGRVQKFTNLDTSSPYNFNIEEPKYVGNILQITSDGVLINALEQQKASSKANSNASSYIIGVGKTTVKSVVTKPNSHVRIDTGKIIFIARVDNININPKEIFNVFKLENNKKKRFIELASVTTFGGTKSMDINFIDYKAYPYKNNSFIIELNITEVGEYAVTLNTSRNTFNMFGIGKIPQ